MGATWWNKKGTHQALFPNANITGYFRVVVVVFEKSLSFVKVVQVFDSVC